MLEFLFRISKLPNSCVCHEFQTPVCALYWIKEINPSLQLLGKLTTNNYLWTQVRQVTVLTLLCWL